MEDKKLIIEKKGKALKKHDNKKEDVTDIESISLRKASAGRQLTLDDVDENLIL